ncbi:MAG TPA: hypothetical protein VJK48_00835 [Chlamydiales bacterium]|nr:MAG: hypothetical protein A3F67_11665 [Verrucomicrobia bacterium RIFCSPHIGHO2_12_FULL_41_10]HLB52239.1 hypothetical protein [Chlamydiales bacterium]
MILQVLGSDPVFWFCALSGTGLFVIQLAFSIFGGGELGGEESSGGDAGQFKWLSKQAVTGFLMMFGWIGLTCKKETDFSLGIAVALALIGGCFSIFLIGTLFRFAEKLKSPGTVFRIEEAVGKEAVVYHRIPQMGSGKITLSLHNFSYEIDAVSEHSKEIPSFARVQVVKKLDDKTVLVRGL